MTHNPQLIGKITSFSFSSNTLKLEGVFPSETSGPIDRIKIHFREKEWVIDSFKVDLALCFAIEIPLDSPKPERKYGALLRQGIAYLFPGLFAKIYQTIIKNDNALIAITPISRNQKGQPIYGLIDVKLPLPFERESRKIGGGNFLAISSEFLNLMVEKGGLKKTDRILDVGCGLGRMAYALAYYLAPQARYDGFDIMPSAIARAKKFISPFFPNFHFQHVNVWNSFYNPKGTEQSSSFKFPYEANSFDFVLLTSVFSHMLTSDILHYLSEIHRVLRPGGRCLFSCFLVTDETQELIQFNRSTQKLTHPYGEDCYVVSLEYPEASIGYKKGAMLNLVKQSGFNLEAIYNGSWCGRENFMSYQDLVIIRKE